MNRSIVCGTDSSPVSRAAAQVAAALARELDLKLILAHVAADPPTFPYGDSRRRELQRRDAIRAARSMLEDVASSLSVGDLETKVLLGDPVEALTAEAREQEADLLIVGSRGRGPWRAAALGSVSGALAATAPVPVMVVPSSARVRPIAEDTPATPDTLLHRPFA